MKKNYLLLIALFTFSFAASTAWSQCVPVATYPASAWTDVATDPNPYGDFLCQAHDSIYTRSGWEYYDGDGYWFRLQSGSQVTITVTSCLAPVSLTIVDSTGGPGTGNIIAGAFAAAACPNSMTFTAPYTGTFYLVFDSDNNCSTSTTTADGTVSIKLNNAASYPSCNPLQPANDTICGAIAMTLGVSVSGNTTNASSSDPRDNDVANAGFACSAPNNTLWYSFSPPATGNYDINANSPLSGGLDMWIGVFTATSCTGVLNYIDCLVGPLPGTSYTNTVAMSSGITYYLMIDGYSGAIGSFDLDIQANTTGIEENAVLASHLSLYPNPSRGVLNISNSTNHTDIAFSLFNAMGQQVISGKLDSRPVTTLDISGLANGVYSVRFVSEGGTSTSRVVLHHQ